MKNLHILYLILLHFYFCDGNDFSEVNLPRKHMPFYFTNFPETAENCRKNVNCPFKEEAKESQKRCWGYEHGCSKENAYSVPHCQGKPGELANVQKFYKQADFGYILERLEEMQIICNPTLKEDSSLECADHMRFCRGRNLMLNFTDLIQRQEPIRYAMDVLKPGQIGGYCKLYMDRLKSQCDQLSPLQSWGPELKNFVSLENRPIENNLCDVVVEEPTFILKIDATVSMYHHFCDFFNLYASLHMNLSHPHTFSRNVRILVWESYPYFSNFGSVMSAFTKYPIWNLKTFFGKSVCFRNVVFPFLPRMIFGLYYNTPIVWGCENSGLFHAFSKHILHRLDIQTHQRPNSKVRITFLSRQTKYRRILNENELILKLKENPNYIVNQVAYTHQMPFREQLEITHNSDVFIGMHGSGLTHLLFLPDWGTIFEMYNCEDENCYKDLARLRGVKYFTWEDPSKLHREDEGHHPEMGAHAKFTNYAFDVEEFSRIVEGAAIHVRSHPAFQQFLSSSSDIKEHKNIVHSDL